MIYSEKISNSSAPVDAAESFSHKRKEHAGSSINGSLRLENLGTRKRRLSDATDEEASSHANTKSDIRQEIKKLKMNVEENDLQKVTEGLQSSLSKTDKEIRENSSRAKTIDKQISAKDEEHGKRLECEQGNDEDESEATSSDRTSEESGNEGDSNDEAESDSDS